jgi:hypothetical protein
MYYPFWGDTTSDEEQAWQNFIDKVKEYPHVPIYHYGNYELRAINALSKRYGIEVEGLKNRLVNVNSQIFGRVYFPVFSNSLKEIGGFIGATWTIPNSSGLQSLVWRYYWERTRNYQYKNYLLNYNRDDCLALRLLTDQLSKIKDEASTLSEVDFISTPKHDATDSGKEIHDQFESILKFAHANYDEKKIKFRQQTGDDQKAADKPAHGHKLGYQGQRRIRPKATKTIEVSAAGQVCPKDGTQLRPAKQTSKRLIINLVLTKRGMRKTIIEYIGQQGYCSQCKRYYAPAEIRKYGPTQLYGHGFQSWVIYQRIALRMTYSSIAEAITEQFNEERLDHNIGQFIKNASQV